MKSSESSGVLIDGVTEAVKLEIKKTKRWIYWWSVSNFGWLAFSDASSDCFSGKIYYWKRSHDESSFSSAPSFK